MSYVLQLAENGSFVRQFVHGMTHLAHISGQPPRGPFVPIGSRLDADTMRTLLSDAHPAERSALFTATDFQRATVFPFWCA
jgi:hypothetical protein